MSLNNFKYKNSMYFVLKCKPSKSNKTLIELNDILILSNLY